jgi:hypothetical protein
MDNLKIYSFYFKNKAGNKHLEKAKLSSAETHPWTRDENICKREKI